MEWDLSVIYPSFEDEMFSSDFDSLTPQTDSLNVLLASDEDETALLEKVVGQLSCLIDTYTRLGAYINLTLATDAEHKTAGCMRDKLMEKEITLSQCISAFTRRLGQTEHLDEIIARSPILQANGFALRNAKLMAQHTIDEMLEPWILKMSLSGGEAFSQLRDKLDATHMIDFRGESLPLSAIRAKAYDHAPDVRREAYEAELNAYEKIALPMSYCLNSIKAEAETIRQAKHYESVLDMTLTNSNMDRETLDAMWTAVKEYLPDLRRYLKAKAAYLGHKNGLPFYDLFAPVGGDQKVYAIDEAVNILTAAFEPFNPKMAEFIRNAFDQRWIDLYPRKGKGGGAFCADVHCLGISRILTNYAGSFSDISTLAHELGHGWHDYCLKDMPVLMTDCPMPLAETASIFNETMLVYQTMKSADDQTAFALIESELMEATQTVVDIYSRYLFETNVITTRKDHTLSVDELKEMMLNAQEAAYGDGLDPNARHPYMWACKPHYYFSNAHFYNFPYAFGLLFGKGVFAQYLKKGSAFIPEYNRLLASSGSDTVVNIAASAGINVRDADFWRSSLDVIRESVNRFEALVNRKLNSPA